MFLTGTMLVGVGCKNYDDDINNLQNQVDGLNKEVVALNSLEARLKAVEATAAEFKKIDFSKFVKDTDLATKLAQLQTEFNNKLAGYATTGQLNDAKAALQAMINAKTDLAAVQALLADYAKKADVNTKAEINKLLSDQFTKITTNADNWLGEHFAAYMKTYVTGDEFKSAAAGAANAALLEKLNAANAEYVDAISKVLDAMTGDKAVVRKKDLEVLKEKYDKDIADLWIAIGKLASRIQSLVFVPKYTDGAIGFGTQYIGSGNNKIALNKTAQTVATFRVTPASLANLLVEQVKAKTIKLTMLDEELETRAAEPKIVIVGDPIATDDGKISLVLSTEYNFAKDLAVALNVTEVNGDEYGTEFNSAYVPVKNFGEEDVTANLKIAKMVDEDYEEVTANNNNLTLVYNSTDVVNIFNDISLVYDLGGKLVSIADAASALNWTVTPAIKTTTTAFTNFGDPTNYTVTPANPMAAADVNKAVSVKIAANKTGVVGQTLSLTTTYSAAVDAKNVEVLASAVSTVTISKAILGEITNVNATYKWNYAAYNTDSYVSGDVILQAGKLTADQFNNKIDWANVNWTVTPAPGTPVVGTIAVKSAKISNPAVDSDAQIISLTVSGYKNGNGTAAIEALADVGLDAQVKIKGTITFNGLPDMAYAINVAAPVNYTIGTTVDVTATTSLNTTLYTALGSSQKYFANAGQFDAFLATLSVEEAAQAKVAATKVPAADLAASNDNQTLTVKFTLADIDFNAADKYTYTAPEKARLAIADNATEFFKVAITGGVTINKANGYYLGQGTSLYVEEGKTPYMLAKGAANTTTSTFTVDQVQLSTGYGPKSPAGNTKQIEVTYSLVNTIKPTDYTGELPTIDGTTSGKVGVLDWHGCQLDKVAVKAVMTVDGLPVDTKTFDVQIQKPIDFAAWAVFPTKAIKVDLNATTVKAFEIMDPSGITPAVSYSKDIFGNTMIKAAGIEAWAAADAAYKLTATFGDAVYTSSVGAETFERFEFDKTTGVLNIKADNAELVGTVTVKVPVTFTYKYALNAADKYKPVQFTKEVTITVTKK